MTSGLAPSRPSYCAQDIKVDNILVAGRITDEASLDFATWSVKISDLDGRHMTLLVKKNVTGIPYWFAPEMLTSHRYSWPVDIYAIGILIWEVLMKETPFASYQRHEFMRAVGIEQKSAEILLSYIEHRKYSAAMEAVLAIMCTCLRESGKRPAANALLIHLERAQRVIRRDSQMLFRKTSSILSGSMRTPRPALPMKPMLHRASNRFVNTRSRKTGPSASPPNRLERSNVQNAPAAASGTSNQTLTRAHTRDSARALSSSSSQKFALVGVRRSVSASNVIPERMVASASSFVTPSRESGIKTNAGPFIKHAAPPSAGGDMDVDLVFEDSGAEILSPRVSFESQSER